MKKFFITVLLLATMLFSATLAQTSQVSYYNGDSIPLFQGTLAYQDGFNYNSLENYIISSDEAFYSAQYYGARNDSPQSIKLAVLDNYVVWQFDFVDQVICIDAQDATNAYALPVDGIEYTYIIDDFSYNNAVYADTTEATSYANNGSASVAVYEDVTQVVEAYNISNDGYSNLYNGYATYEAYLAAYMAQVASAVSQSVVQSPAVVGPVENLGIIAVTNSIGSNNFSAYDSEGYSVTSGYDREGYNREGYNREGFDRDGYTLAGYSLSGYDREGYNPQGFNAQGYNREGQRN